MQPFLKLSIRQLIAKRLGVGPDLNFTDRRTRQLAFTYGFSLIGSSIVIAYGWFYLIQGVFQHAAVDFLFGLLALSNVLALRRHGRLSVATGIVLIAMLVLTGYLFTSGGLVGTGFLWVFTIPILAFFLDGASRGAVWMVAVVFEIGFLNILQGANLVHTAYTSQELNQILVGVITVGVMILLFELITERYESELQRQEHELEKFKLVADQATDGVVMTDHHANIVYVNRAWEKLTGYRSEDVVGKNPRIIKSGKTPTSEYQKMWKALNAGRPFSSEAFINRRKDGREYNAQVHFFAIRSADRNLFFVQLQQDITERVSIDRAKTEFVSLASHQLTTPLSAIGWFGELMHDPASGKLPLKQQHLLSRIEQANQEMVSLVNALLDVSRIDLGTFAILPVPTQVGQLTKQLMQEVGAAHPGRAKMTVTMESGLPSVKLDPNLFRIVLQNLLTNALRYTPPTGRIKIALQRDGRWLKLDVTDTGIGIPAADREKIFGKFFRATNAQLEVPNGNGLGLFIVKAIADATGGSIQFSSIEKRGTTFTMRFPLSGMRPKAGTRQLASAA